MRDRQTEIEADIHSETDVNSERQTDIEADIHSERQTDRHRGRHTQ